MQRFLVLGLVVLSILGLRAGQIFQSSELWTLDLFFRLSPSTASTDRITIIGITEDNIQQYGYPINDRLLAQSIKILKQHNPSAIGLDLYRDLPVPPGHQELINVFQSTPNLYGIEQIVGGPVAPPPALPPSQVTASDLIPDGDGVIRRTLLYQGDRPTLGLAVALHYLKHQGITAQAGDNGWLQLADAQFVPLRGSDGGYIRADNGGYQILLNYSGPPNTFNTITLSDVLTSNFDPNLIRDRIIFIGTIAQSSNDAFFTPYSWQMRAIAPQRMYGVEVQANVTNHILTSVLDGRPQIQTFNDPLEVLWITFWIGSAGLIIWTQRYKKRFPFWTITIGSGTSISLCAIAYTAFTFNGWWLPITPNLTGIGAVAIIIPLYLYVTQLQDLVAEQAKQLERNQRLVLLGQLMAGVAHDIKNPANTILNYVNLCLHQLSEIPENRQEKWHKRLQAILVNIQTINQVINSLRCVTAHPHPIQTNPNSTFQTIYKLVAYKHDRVHYECDFDPTLDHSISLPSGINPILFNLLNNALDAVNEKTYPDDEHPTIRLATRNLEDKIELSIWDNGIGIPPELLKENRLYQPFQTKKKHGTGLGLFTVYETLNHYGGTISVDSKPNQYTQFTITLPKLNSIYQSQADSNS